MIVAAPLTARQEALVHFAGAQADVRFLRSQLRVGQPISVLEGSHFGLPVVATELGGFAGVVNDDSGRFMPSDAPSETLKVILEVLEPEEWKRISEHNRNMAEKDLSVERLSEQMTSVLLEVRA